MAIQIITIVLIRATTNTGISQQLIGDCTVLNKFIEDAKKHNIHL